MEREFKSTHFIKIPNCYISQGDEKLTPDELYMYVTLFLQQQYDGQIYTSAEMLNAVMPIKYNKASTRRKKDQIYLDFTRNKRSIELLIQSLSDKGAIKISQVNPQSNSELIKITLADTTGKLFVKIDYGKYADISSINDFYIYCVVSSFDYRIGEGAKIDYVTWGRLLDCTPRSAKTHISTAVENGTIHKDTGDYLTISKQDVNTYSTKQLADHQKSKQTLVSELKQYNHSDYTSTGEQETRLHQWLNQQVDRFNIRDFIVLVTTKDQSVINAATSKIKRICASGEAGKAAMDNLHKQANELVEQYKEAHNVVSKMKKENPFNSTSKSRKPPVKTKSRHINIDSIF